MMRTVCGALTAIGASAAGNRRPPPARRAIPLVGKRAWRVEDYGMAKMIDRPSGLGATPTPEFEEQRARWEARYGAGKRRSEPGSGAADRTISDLPLKPLYGPADVEHLDLARDLAYPG